MENNTKLVEELLEKATDYGKTSLELLKLKVVDKTSDGLSSFLPGSVLAIILGSFLLFVNLGLALWFGKMLGDLFYGFFVVAGFYAFVSIVLHFIMRKWLKRILNDYMIKQLLK